jgi:hypothetical protein
MGGYVYAPDAEVGAGDADAIRGACLDYAESWYEADAERMRGCLHPDLDKRGMVRRVIDTRAELFSTSPTTASGLVELTELGVGRTAPADRRADVTILAATHHLASAEVVLTGMVDLLHLMKFPDGWKIVQTIWCLQGGIVATMSTDV